MRFDAEHKGQTRERILKAAAAVVRTKGVDSVGVAEVMADAGLTVGGFYTHFKNKEDMIAHAIIYAFEERYARRLDLIADLPPAEALNHFIADYLSERHLANVAHGCPVPALVSDVSRSDLVVKAGFTQKVDRVITLLGVWLEKMGWPAPYDTAMSVASEMFGAVSTARAVDDDRRAEAILAASRRAIRARLKLETPPAGDIPSDIH